MIIALNKYTEYIFTSSQICMMSSCVYMEIFCISNIGSISSKNIAGVKNCCKMSYCNIFLLKIGRNILNVLEKIILS